MDTKWIVMLAAALASAPLALGHFPPAPNTNCDPDQDTHDFVAAGSVTVTSGITGEFGGGATVVIDGAGGLCGTEALCEPGSEIARVDPDGENPAPTVDPNGEDIVVRCDEFPSEVQDLQVPVGDGEYEFGVGGAFLLDTHHDPTDASGYTVTPAFTDGGFVFGSDAEGDGAVEEGSADCFESQSASGNYVSACPVGADGGWWLFTKCNATAASDWTFTTNGALLRGFGDDDEDDVPNFAEDDDNDGVPNGAEDNDSDGAPDLVNANWNPTVTPGSVPPDAGASCLVSGHVEA